MLQLRQVSKTYRKDGQAVIAADSLDLDINEGDLVVVHGPSGSGKSTLLMMLGGMLPPDDGAVLYDQADIYRWRPSRRNRYRRETVGFMFQRFFLMPYLSVYDNIRMPLALAGRGEDRQAVLALARRLRIGHRLDHKAGQLSVGELQRTSVARALVGGQKLILADEPTGNLDAENIEIVGQCLKDESARGRIVVLVTHNRDLLDLGTRRVRIEGGRLAGPREGQNP